MLKDREIKELRQMLLRLSRYDDRILEIAVHTKDAERGNLLLAREAVGNAFKHLSFVVCNGIGEEEA